MNKYSARGLVESVFVEKRDVLVVCKERRDVRHTFDELVAAANTFGIPIARMLRTSGAEEITIRDAGKIIVRVDPDVIRVAAFDVIYFDYEPELDKAMAITELHGRRHPPLEIVRPS